MEDNIQESTRPLGPKPLPTRIIVNTDTGAADLYVDEGVFGRTKIAEGSAIGNNWAVNDEFVRRWNNRNGTNLTKDQLQKVFTRDLQSTVNYDRANIINKYSATNTKTYLSQTAKLPGIIDQEEEQLLRVPNSQPGPAPAAPPVGTQTETSQLAPDKIQGTNSEFAKTSKARETYEQDLRYPENLQLEHQDCIKFTVFKYTPRGLSLVQNPERRKLQGKDSKGSIILPIPGGISDSNQVDWQKDDLDLATQGIADFIVNFVSNGPSAGAASAQNTLGALGADKKALESLVAVKTAQPVTGTNVLSRAYGGVLNPNSELLFSGPQLRNFTFTFRMSPRSSGEAKMVQKIIRTFKQAMSVQRNESVLILKAPNTFGIEYLTKDKNLHPYLTKFKECALTQCNVNYTPDGTYMTYAGEPSMTAYELQLTFQELEPIFNDDYGNDYDNVGY